MADTRTQSHGHALRRGRFSESGTAYLITTVTFQREPWFQNFYYARSVINAMRHQDRNGACETLAWVLMPDHLHWLFVLQNGDLSSLIGRFKQHGASHINQINQQAGRRVWQSGFHDHAIRKEEDVAEIARYIVANPLRAGLVGHIGEYPHWDAVWL
ncbi:MAG: transposase [Pseudomonadota bacterium]